MKKIIRYTPLLLLLMASIGNTKTESDTVLVEQIILSNSVTPNIDSTFDPGNSVEIFTNKDEIIFYRPTIAVINPTKKKYNTTILCVDSKDNVVYTDSLKMPLEKIRGHIDKKVIGLAAQHLGLDPKPGAMIKGQLIPLANNNYYYIKLYVEKKLIGITKFKYIVKN